MSFLKKIFRKIKIYYSTDDETNREIKKAKFLASRKFSLFITIVLTIVITLISNIIANGLDIVFSNIKGKEKAFNFLEAIFYFEFNKYWYVYIFTYIMLILIIIKIQFRLKTSFRTINEGQKGKCRFCSLLEIEEQYKSVPKKEKEFEGKGGVVISSYEDKVFIDEGDVNNLVIGTTRSGKGELFLFPTIDVYSRAKVKSSLIINDPKGEFLASSKDTLEKRGYRIEVLNLIDPNNSMSYNPLHLIVEAYLEKDYGEAQKLCKSLTYSMYYKPNVKDPFWQNSAMSLVNALILAILEECYKKYGEEEIKNRVTMFTVANMLSELGSAYDEDGNNELDKYFRNLPSNSIAKMQYATSNFAKGSARSGIFSFAMTEIEKFTMEKIAKMTSRNSINLKDFGFINKEDDRPIALFMILPDYDNSDYFIASMFIRQLYWVLSKEATLTKGGKCEREVVFLIDEAGNMPPIEQLEVILTICLGRNIKFTLVVQAFSQIEEKYGKDKAKTIIGNCANKVYIMTTEYDTAEEFSKLLGDKTIINISRSGEITDTTKHYTESVDSERLKNPNDLMLLKMGETVVTRNLKREDQKRNRIVPNPIFNSGKTSMQYRYEYLSKWFDNNSSIADVEIPSLHKDVDLNDLILFENIEPVIIEEQSIKDIKQEEKERKLLLNEIFSPMEIKEIIELVEARYKKGKTKINLDSTFDDLEKACKENNDNKEIKSFVDKGFEYIKELERK
ncbi:VirD4-like conjugal transfer protein, CD1115 family [Clostridium perfringens]|uniref:VirD4-like conjugal transfer protein, CD1115 family n=1 Tax=Clostridium perfringens TaxID=1502 RepID=UPI0024BC54B3|nr:type IV secretory system conjugative DNA transfer family protein [Clostridium perfringens]